MKFFDKIWEFFNKYMFNAKWRCVVCKREIFDGGYFCKKCKSKLPYNDGAKCLHCGRKLKNSQNYCTTCKGKITDIDKGRSVYNYEPPISALIKAMKYNNKRYLAQAFALDLSELYKESFEADFAVYVPATKKSVKKRGYNQSELLAREFSKLTDLPIVECLEKVKETDRQAKLDKSDRAKNIKDAFKVTDKKAVAFKRILIIDDVTTTGATAQAIAQILKKAHAEKVYLLSIASVPPQDGY